MAIHIIEKLIDKYHFKDTEISFDNEVHEQGFLYVNNVIESDLKNVPEETLIKILGVLRFVAKRRTRGGREYLTIINQFVGERLDKRIRLLKGL